MHSNNGSWENISRDKKFQTSNTASPTSSYSSADWILLEGDNSDMKSHDDKKNKNPSPKYNNKSMHELIINGYFGDSCHPQNENRIYSYGINQKDYLTSSASSDDVKNRKNTIVLVDGECSETTRSNNNNTKESLKNLYETIVLSNAENNVSLTEENCCRNNQINGNEHYHQHHQSSARPTVPPRPKGRVLQQFYKSMLQKEMMEAKFTQ